MKLKACLGYLYLEQTSHTGSKVSTNESSVVEIYFETGTMRPEMSTKTFTGLSLAEPAFTELIYWYIFL